MSTERHDVDPLDLVAHVLGEGVSAERDAVRRAVAEDIGRAAELAETTALLERMRELTVTPTGRVANVARREARRRLELRGLARPTWAERRTFALRVAAVALIWLGVSWAAFGDGLRDLWRAAPAPVPFDEVAVPGRLERRIAPVADGVADVEARRLCALDHLPIDDPRFVAAYQDVSNRPVPGSFEGWLSADNLLSQLRGEAEARFSPGVRAALRAATGVPDLDQRIQVLAAELAARLDRDLAEERATTESLASGLRGLAAAGSSLSRGPHRDTVARVVAAAATRLESPSLGDADRAELTVALGDLAVIDGGHDGLDHRVGELADELSRQVLRRREDGRRPELLSTRTSAALVADLGQLLQIAPAFGTHGGLAFKARLALGAHLIERETNGSDAERPELVAAQLYGFGDLGDRRELDHRLKLWQPHLLLPDFRALRQFAWSRYPVRPGWAGFQRELRRLAGLSTPAATPQAARLLQVLCTNTAAPGILDIVAQAIDG